MKKQGIHLSWIKEENTTQNAEVQQNIASRTWSYILTTTKLQDSAECILVYLKSVPKPDNVIMNQGLVNVVLSDSMPDVTLFLLFAPLGIETMELTCNISMVYQVKSLPEISHFKSLQKCVY